MRGALLFFRTDWRTYTGRQQWRLRISSRGKNYSYVCCILNSICEPSNGAVEYFSECGAHKFAETLFGWIVRILRNPALVSMFLFHARRPKYWKLRLFIVSKPPVSHTAILNIQFKHDNAGIRIIGLFHTPKWRNFIIFRTSICMRSLTLPFFSCYI